MEGTIESLEFLELLDNVADETVSQALNDIGPTTTSCCEFGENYTLDLLSICDTMSVNDTVSLPKDNTQTTEADDTETHVQGSVLEPTARTLDSKMTDLAFENVNGCCNSTTAILSPSDHPSSFYTNGQARDGCRGKRGRWHFHQWQREQLDEVFHGNMYPSRWTLTELSTALQVPVRNLRNRRWRYRKTMGLKGDLRTRGLKGDLGTRGSRTKLPAKDMKRKGHTGHLFTRSTGGQCPEVTQLGVISPQPVKSSLAQLNTTSSSSSASVVYRPTPLYFTPAQHPAYSSLGQQYSGAWQWSMSAFSANWNWLRPSACLYPFSNLTSALWPNWNYGQPLLYPVGINPTSPGQMWPRERLEAVTVPGCGQASVQPASCESVMPSHLLRNPLLPERGLPAVGGQTESTVLDCTVSKICISETCNGTVNSSRTMASQIHTPPLTDVMTSLSGLTAQNPDLSPSISSYISSLKNKPFFNHIDPKTNALAVNGDHFHMAATASPAAVHPLRPSEACLNSRSAPDWPALSAGTGTSVYPEPGFSLSGTSVSSVELQSAESTSGDGYGSGVSRVADVREGWSTTHMSDVEETNGCSGEGDLDFVDVMTVDQSIQDRPCPV